MAEYQNIFTRVVVHGPAPYPGVALPRGDSARFGTATFNHMLGKVGDAQLGPIYLGYGHASGGNSSIYLFYGRPTDQFRGR